MGDYFIRMEDAKQLRRKVLESSKASLSVLKGYHTLLKVRGEKMTLMKNLRRELKELTTIVNKVEEMMPTLTESELKNFRGDAETPALGSGPKRKTSKKKTKKRGGTRKRTPALPKLKDDKHVYVGFPEDSKKKPEVSKPKPVRKETSSEPKSSSELEGLQSQMKAIEDKLGKL